MESERRPCALREGIPHRSGQSEKGIVVRKEVLLALSVLAGCTEAAQPAAPIAASPLAPRSASSILWQEVPKVLLPGRAQVVTVSGVPEGVDLVHLVASRGAGATCPDFRAACLGISGTPALVVPARVNAGTARFTVRAPAELVGQVLNLQVAGPEAAVDSNPIRLRVVSPQGDEDGDTLDNLSELELHTNPLAADSDGDRFDDALELTMNMDPLSCEDPDADEDEDGLNDCDEQVYGTRVDIADTDGDGFTDGEEIDNGFSPVNNNFKFNPRIADTPRIEITLASAPSLALLYESSSGSEDSFEVERSESSSESVTQSEGASNSLAIEFTATAGGSVTVGAEAGFPELFGASAEASVYAEASLSTSTETAMTWSLEQSVEHSEGFSAAKAQATSQGTTLTGGVIGILANVCNTGDIAYTLENMAITAYMTTPGNQRILSPVGNLSFDTTQTGFPAFSYGPNQCGGPFAFINDGLDLDTIQTLLQDSSSLNVSISAYELTDEYDRPFAHHQTQVFARTATIIVDYEGEDAQRPSERYQVATNTDPATLRVSAAEALEDTMRLDIALDSNGRLHRVRTVADNEERNGYWTVVHLSTDGFLDSADLYRPEDDYDLRDLELKSGDTLHLVYVEDPDGDGLGGRLERASGTDFFDADTDGDGLPDGDEVYIHKSSPLKVDTDEDGWTDDKEVNDLQTDPANPDNDGDGYARWEDCNDRNPQSTPLYLHVFQGDVTWDDSDWCALGYGAISGGLTATPATTLSDLSCLCEVHGGIQVENTTLEDLTALSSLRSASNLFISHNASLMSLAGIEKFAWPAATVVIRNNDSLESLAGLERPAHLFYLHVEDNDNLTSLAGASNLTSVKNLSILRNDSLSTLSGLESLRRIDLMLNIRANNSLVDLSALEGLQRDNETGFLAEFTIANNMSLGDAAAWALVDAIGEDNISGAIDIRGN